MGEKLNLNGKTFGELTVIKELHPNNSGKILWECKCSCGKIKKVVGSNLVNGRSKTCGSCVKVPNLIGKQFGILTVKEYLGLHQWNNDGTHKVAMWLCEDDVGFTKRMSTAELNLNRRVHVNMAYTPRQAALSTIFIKYKSSAKKRNREFTIPKRNFIELILESCNYCGMKPENVSKPRSKKKAIVMYNGLDRVDSSKGYTLDNVVPCCYKCNYSKNNFLQKEFFTWIKALSENLHKKGLITLELDN